MNEAQAAVLAQKYSDLLRPVAQQSTSKMSGIAMIKSGLVGMDVQALDYVDKVEFRTITDPLVIRDTVYDSANAQTRWLPRPVIKKHVWGTYDEAKLTRLVDLQSGVRDAQLKGLNRVKDILIYNAALGDALVGQTNNTGATPVSMTAPAAIVVLPAANKLNTGGAASTTSPTDYILEALEKFQAMDVDTNEVEIDLYVDSTFLKALREDPNYITWNITGDQIGRNGAIKPYMGVNIKTVSDSILTVNGAGAAAYRKLPFIVKDSVCLGIWADVKTTLKQDTSKDDIWKLDSSLFASAARLNEWGVIELDWNLGL